MNARNSLFSRCTKNSPDLPDNHFLRYFLDPKQFDQFSHELRHKSAKRNYPIPTEICILKIVNSENTKYLKQYIIIRDIGIS